MKLGHGSWHRCIHEGFHVFMQVREQGDQLFLRNAAPWVYGDITGATELRHQHLVCGWTPVCFCVGFGAVVALNDDGKECIQKDEERNDLERPKENIGKDRLRRRFDVFGGVIEANQQFDRCHKCRREAPEALRIVTKNRDAKKRKYAVNHDQQHRKEGEIPGGPSHGPRDDALKKIRGDAFADIVSEIVASFARPF